MKRRRRPHVMLFFGTRPEAIKLAPVIRRLKEYGQHLRTTVVVTAQHREMLDQVLRIMHVKPDVDLNLMKPGQTLAGLTAVALQRCEAVLARRKPDLILVQGDTATTLASTLAAFYQKIPVGHVEAGLRTYDRDNPFPEEISRQMVTRMATWHFAATRGARDHLLAEGVARSQVFITGNTVVDALYSVLDPRYSFGASALPFHPDQENFVLITAHRRENFGKPLEKICRALKRLAVRFPEKHFVLPVHRNPHVRSMVGRQLKHAPSNVHQLAPLEYRPFIHLLARADLVLTDSGGIQEEAPALGIPVFILRQKTERPEALSAGARLVALDSDKIVASVSSFLTGKQARPIKSRCPFGDGRAAERIAGIILWKHGLKKEPPKPFRS